MPTTAIAAQRAAEVLEPRFPGDAAGGEQGRIDRRAVIGLAVDDDDNRRHNEIGDRQRPKMRIGRPRGEAPQAGKPDQRRDGADKKRLLQQQYERRQPDASRGVGAGDAGRTANHVCACQMTLGRRQRHRQRSAGVEPRPRQAASQRRRDDADRERGHVEDDQILALEADADDGAECEPPAFVAAIDEAHENPGAAEPSQRLQAVGRQQHAAGEQRRREQDAEPGQPSGRNGRRRDGGRDRRSARPSPPPPTPGQIFSGVSAVPNSL